MPSRLRVCGALAIAPVLFVAGWPTSLEVGDAMIVSGWRHEMIGLVRDVRAEAWAKPGANIIVSPHVQRTWATRLSIHGRTFFPIVFYAMGHCRRVSGITGTFFRSIVRPIVLYSLLGPLTIDMSHGAFLLSVNTGQAGV